MNVVEAHRLGKRYGRTWALHDFTLAVPDGRVAALVGPNGAGKTTLLNLAVGLAAPSTGEITVLDGQPPGSPRALDGTGFVAQDAPLYKSLSAAELLRVTRDLNRHFDQRYAECRLADLGIPLDRKAGRLSRGQQAQLALTLALARRPRLLLLDEPMAMLDPLARHGFMACLMTAVADDGVSVILSSHVLIELERVADYLVLISQAAFRSPATSTASWPPTACCQARALKWTGVRRDGAWCRAASARRRPSCWSGRTAPRTAPRPVGRRTRSASKSSRWPT